MRVILPGRTNRPNRPPARRRFPIDDRRQASAALSNGRMAQIRANRASREGIIRARSASRRSADAICPATKNTRRLGIRQAPPGIGRDSSRPGLGRQRVGMSNLVFEILLRMAKVAAAAVLGLVLYLVISGPFGVSASVELALLCWLSAAAFILLVESSPI